MALLLPRLPGPAADAIVQRFLDQDSKNWQGFNARRMPESVRFAATGGSRITEAQLQSVRDRLKELASKYIADAGSTRVAHSRFDAIGAAWLAQEEAFASGEALRDDVWNFVGAVLAPDIVYWRFGAARERYIGGPRNALQRLWMRGRALDRGISHPQRWQLLAELTEDALVQITERPSIGADPVLALALGEAWLRASRHYGKPAMEPIMRRAVLRIRIRNEIRALVELSTVDLSKVLDQAFGTPAATLGTEAPQEAKQLAENLPLTSGGRSSGKDVAPSASSLTTALDKIFAAARLRNWLSPKSVAAFGTLRSGSAAIDLSQRNALEYLLRRIQETSELVDEVNQVKAAISSRSGATSVVGSR